MTWKCMFDVFGGSGFLAKATSHLGLRGHVLETKFGLSFDVTQPIVLTRIRQDVSAGKSLPLQHTSCSSKEISASAAIANLLLRARMPWILEHPCDSWLWDVPKNRSSCGAASHGVDLGGFLRVWITVQKANAVSGWKTWMAGTCTVWLASVLGWVDVAVFRDKNMVTQRNPHHAQSFAHHVITPTNPSFHSRLPRFLP